MPLLKKTCFPLHQYRKKKFMARKETQVWIPGTTDLCVREFVWFKGSAALGTSFPGTTDERL